MNHRANALVPARGVCDFIGKAILQNKWKQLLACVVKSALLLGGELESLRNT